MKTYEVQVRIEGTIDVEDPNCPSGWRGSGCYMTACKCWQDVTVTLTAENEAVAKKLAKQEAQYRNIIDVDKVKYRVSVFSHSCKPVEE